jgi:trk system potassium uptake protein TrkA
LNRRYPDRSFVHLLSLQHDDFAIVDAKVSEQSAVAHRALAEIELPEDTTIAAIARGAKLIVPGPATELLPGDDIIAIARQNKEDELRRLLV